MAVIFDRPLRRQFRGRIVFTSHLVSDRVGVEGARELLAVAKRLGLRSAWLQHRDTPYEHFDLIGAERIDRARRLPGLREVDPRELIPIFRAKFRAALEASAAERSPETNQGRLVSANNASSSPEDRGGPDVDAARAASAGVVNAPSGDGLHANALRIVRPGSSSVCAPHGGRA